MEKGELELSLLEEDERKICWESKEAMPCEKVDVSVVRQEEPESGHIGILQNFADAVRLGKPLIAPGEEGIRGLTLSNAAYLSQWTDGWVEIPFDEADFLRRLSEKQKEEDMIRNIAEDEN